MNIRNIGIIISREYATRVRKKSFLVITFIVPVLFALLCTLPALIMFLSKETGKVVEVLDESGIVMSHLAGSDAVSFRDCSGQDLEALKKGLDGEGADAVMYVSPLDTVRKTVTVDLYSIKPVSVEIKESIAGMAAAAVEDYRLSGYEIQNLRQIIEDVKADVQVSTYTLGEDGQEQITSSEVYMFVSIALTLIIYMFIAMFSGMVMTSVIEEKSSKVAEVLVSSVKASELMFGKIIGVACVALTQFFLWIVLAVVIIAGVNATVGFDSLAGADPAQMEQLTQMSGMDMSMVDTMVSGSSSEMAAVIETLKDLNYGQLIFSFVVYFLLGYLLYASLFAAIGSAVDNEGDSTQLQLPVTVPLLLAFFIAFYAFEAPDSQLAFWGSIIPFTSPIVMLARLPFGVPGWELALSIVLLLLTFVALAYISARIYRVGLLVSGKKTTFSDLWKWLRQR